MRIIKALLAAGVLLAVVGAPPAALVRYIGNPWPAEGVSLSAPLTDGAIIGLLAVIVWVLWAQLLLCIAAEVIAAISSDEISWRPPLTLGIQQDLARRLVTAIIAGAIAIPAAGGTGAMAAPATPSPGSTAAVAVSEDQELNLEQQLRNQTSNTATDAPTADRAQEPAGPAQGPTESVTVMRLDSLYEIADRHLGDGNRWTEIAALNEGRAMLDGTVFTAADHIRPGWKLQIPASDQTGTLAEHQREVEPGDTLSQIALEELGDAAAYPDLVDASADTVQPDGRQLTNADLIYPGWKITIPGKVDSEVSPEAPTAGDRAVEPSDSASESAPTADGAPVQKVEERADEDATGVAGVEEHAEKNTAAADPDEAGWPIRTVGGVGALLAAALLGLIAWRRARQRRDRQPGQQVPLPQEATQQVETELRQVADPLGLEAIDGALKVLAVGIERSGLPMPQLRVARLTEAQLDLYFAEDASLQAPFEATQEPSVWALPADAAKDMEELTADVDAPWPALVSIGHDEEGGLILVNLQEAGTFAVTGEESAVHQVMTAIAIELGTASWADQSTVITAGGLVELGDVLQPGRVRYVPHAGAIGKAGPGQIIVDVDRVISQDQHDELVGAGAVVITNRWAASENVLDVDGNGRGVLNPYGLTLHAQTVDQRTYAGLVDVLDTSLLQPGDARTGAVTPFDDIPPEDTPAPPHIDVVELHEPQAALDEPLANDHEGFQFLEELAAQEGPADTVDGETPSDTATAASTAQLGGVEEEVRDIPPAELIEDLTVGDDESETAEAQIHPRLVTGHPVVRILGPVADVIGTETGPKSETHRAVLTRIATYLTLNPDASRQALVTAIWGGKEISKSTVDSRLSNLRAWFGADENGQKYLPAQKSLRFSEKVTSDWAVFTQILGGPPAAAATADLEAALELVRGRPLEGEDSHHYGFAEYAVVDVFDSIVDAAYELGRRRYFEGSWRKAGKAASLGVLLDPGNERLWRLRILAAHSAGQPDQVAEAIDRMHARISDLGFDLEDETIGLVDGLKDGDHAVIEQAREAL